MARHTFQPQCSRQPIQLRIRAPGVLGPPVRTGGLVSWRRTGLEKIGHDSRLSVRLNLQQRYPVTYNPKVN